MELVYIYINKSENNFIEQQEISFSKQYNISYDKDKCITIMKNEKYYNIFRNNNDILQNISAIVGPNGAGKTTVLKTLYYFSLFGETEETREEYISYHNDRVEKAKGIKIYKVNNNLIVYQNIDKDMQVYLDSKKLNCYYEDVEGKNCVIYTEGYHERVQRNYKKNLEKVTNVYMTNGSNSDDDVSGYGLDTGTTSNIFLTRNTIDQIAYNFYKKNSLINNLFTLSDVMFNYLQERICKELNKNKFNKLLLFRYLGYLHNIENMFFGKKVERFYITIENNWKLIHSIRDELKSTNKEDRCYKLKDGLDKMDKLLALINNNSKFDIIVNLKYLWIEEVVLIFHNYINVQLSKRIQLDSLIDMLKNCLIEMQQKNEQMNKYNEYYLNSLEVIKKFDKIIKSCDIKYSNNKLPESDLACNKEVIVDYESPLHNKIKDFIESEIDNEYSFILKYLKVDFGLSSGEEATLNTFSWIYSLNFLSKFDSKIIESTEENILLLLDEVELYAHPEWQRNIVETLVNNIDNYFKGKKVQVILATHSPLTLSDIPDDNVNLIQDGHMKNREKGHTFGANIYDLYKKEFILDLSIGSYAKSKIDEVLSFFDAYEDGSLIDTNLSVDEVKYIIYCVGEPLLRKLLLSKWDTLFGVNHND